MDAIRQACRCACPAWSTLWADERARAAGRNENQGERLAPQCQRPAHCASRIVQKTRKFTRPNRAEPIFQAVRRGRAKLSRNRLAADTTMDGPAGVSWNHDRLSPPHTATIPSRLSWFKDTP